MSEDDRTTYKLLTEPEVIEAISWAMTLRVRRVKMGRCKFDEAVTMDRGLDWFGREVAEQLRLSGIVLMKKPLMPQHGKANDGS